MEMYKNFASSYDQIFPLDGETLTFLAANFPARTRLLDVGCGTGAYAHALGEKGYPVVGIEPNPDMLAVANNHHRRQNVTFWPLGLENLDEPNAFGGVYCIGNVLVHLDTQKAILAALKRLNAALVPGGKLVLQIVNYDRILDQKITALPTINGEGGTRFERAYAIRRDKVVFTTTLVTPDKTFSGTVHLLPLRAKKLESMLKEAGFTDIRLNDGFSTHDFDGQNSFALVATAVKN